jgi:hypothetical protein
VLSADGRVLTPSANVDLALLKALGRAHAWLNMLLAGKAKSIEDLSRQAKKHRGDIWPILRLAFLSPEITRAILEGRQPPHFSLARLLASDIPLSWPKQAKLFT